jgi:hypothetical protein
VAWASERTLRSAHAHPLGPSSWDPLAAAQLQAPKRASDKICGSALPCWPNILKPEAGFLVVRRHSAAALPNSLRLHLLPDPSQGGSDVAPHQSRGLEERRRDCRVCTYQGCGAGLIPSCAHRVYTDKLLGILPLPGQRGSGF